MNYIKYLKFIKNNVDEEKNTRFKLIENILVNFENNLSEINQSNNEKFQYFGEKVYN